MPRSTSRSPHLSTVLPLAVAVLALLSVSARSAEADETSWTSLGAVETQVQIAPLRESDGFTSVARLSDGRRLAAGRTRVRHTFSSATRDDFGLALYGVDGALDPLFAPCAPTFLNTCPTPGTRSINFQSSFGGLPVTLTLGDDAAADVAIRSGDSEAVGDDAIFIVGHSTLGSATSGAIARLDATGELDNSFDGDGLVLFQVEGDNAKIAAAGFQSDGKLVVAGTRTTGTDTQDFFVARLLDNGSLDPTFGSSGITTISFGADQCAQASDLAVDANDSIVLVGSAWTCALAWDDHSDVALARLHPDGTLDVNNLVFPSGPWHVGFSTDGMHTEAFGTSSQAQAVVIDNDASILVAGSSYRGANAAGLIARFSSGGALSAFNELEPDIDLGEPFAGTFFTDVGVTSGGVISVVGSAKGGLSGNAFFQFPFFPDLALGLDSLALHFIAETAAGAGLLILPDDRSVMVGGAGGKAAIVQATYNTCGDGVLDFDEECEAPMGGCCDECRIVAAATLCRFTLNECDLAESCDGVTDQCPADTFVAADVECGDEGDACTEQDRCDGLGSCTDNGFAVAGTGCGDVSDTECSDPDTCDGFGTCATNDATPGAPCADLGDACTRADYCLFGSCVDAGFLAAGAPCGEGNDTECTNPDECDGGGNCLELHEADGSLCGDPGTECIVQDTCTDGTCTDQGFVAPGILCGNASDTECSDPDSCDGVGTCAPNDVAAGTAAPVDCNDDDLCTNDECNGVGGCQNPAPDSDGDTVIDCEDNCLTTANTDQADADMDAVGDACDNCRDICNIDQLDSDSDCSAPEEFVPGTDCGDACDICPNMDEANLDPTCADALENSVEACCIEEGSIAAAVDPLGGQCEDPGPVEVTSPDGEVSLLIPPGAVDEPTTISATRTTKGPREWFIRGGSGRFAIAVDLEPGGQTFDPPIRVALRWEDAENTSLPEAALTEMGAGTAQGCHEGNGRSDDTVFPVHETGMKLFHKDDPNDPDEEPQQFSKPCRHSYCGEIGVDGWPVDWGLDNIGNPNGRIDDPGLGFCCDLCRNQIFFETRSFSGYALAETVCAEWQRPNIMLIKPGLAGRGKVKLKGSFTLDGDRNLQSVIERGVHILVNTAGNEVLFEAAISGGLWDGTSGWSTNGKHGNEATVYRWRRKGGGGGASKVILKRRGGTASNAIQFTIIGKNMDLPAVTTTDLPLQAELVLSAEPGTAASCSQFRGRETSSSICALNSSGSKVICR